MSPIGEFLEPVPITQSPTSAFLRMLGLQMERVHVPQKGFGAAPSSYLRTYENKLGIVISLGALAHNAPRNHAVPRSPVLRGEAGWSDLNNTLSTKGAPVPMISIGALSVGIVVWRVRRSASVIPCTVFPSDKGCEH